jgi:hypothetical protein
MSEMKRLLLCISVLVFLSGCADSVIEADPESNEIIKISHPADNDSIGCSGSSIEYELKTFAGIIFIELYVNDKFSEVFFPVNNQNPVIYPDLDSVLMGERVELYLRYYDKNGSSYKSNTVKNVLVTRSRVLPSPPFNVSLIIIDTSKINISWQDKSPLVTGYEIWRKAGEDGEFLLLLTASPEARNANDENLQRGITYYYKIRTISENGISDYSTIVNSSGSGGSSSVPAPSNLAAVVKGINVVELNWTDNSSNENYFKIERRRDWMQFETVGYADKNKQHYKDSASGLIGGAEYFYRVKAISEKDSSWSNEAYLFMPSYLLEKPSIISVSNTTSREVKLKWQDNDQHYADFIIDRKTEGSNYTEIAKVSGYLDNYSDEVEPLKKYTYRVRQSDGLFNSAYSDEAVIETNIIPLPTPSDFTGYFDGTSVILSWGFSSDADVFIVERKDPALDTAFVVIGQTGGENRIYSDNNTLCQQNYTYRIKAQDPYTSSAYSAEKVIKNWSFCP